MSKLNGRNNYLIFSQVGRTDEVLEVMILVPEFRGEVMKKSGRNEGAQNEGRLFVIYDMF